LKFELLTPAAGKEKKKKPWPLFIERIKKRKEKKRKAWNGVEVRSMFVFLAAASII